MATLPGQRAQFTWALNQYNLAEDVETKSRFAKRMAKYIAAAPANGFTAEQVTQGQAYPFAEIAQYTNKPDLDAGPDISEGQALREVEQAVDVSDVIHLGDGPSVVYAYGYPYAPDRLKMTTRIKPRDPPIPEGTTTVVLIEAHSATEHICARREILAQHGTLGALGAITEATTPLYGRLVSEEAAT